LSSAGVRAVELRELSEAFCSSLVESEDSSNYCVDDGGVRCALVTVGR
jgi:hypothetical protein